MFKFYKNSFIFSLTLGIFVIVGSVIFTINYYRGVGVDDFIMLFLGIPIGVLNALFPIFLNYRQLIYIVLDERKCISYTLFKKKLCQVDFDRYVYYSFFDVKFAYSPLVKFIALSNMPFICNQNSKSVFEKKFYGAYDQRKIIVFPYDNQLAIPTGQGDGSPVSFQNEG